MNIHIMHYYSATGKKLTAENMEHDESQKHYAA
jgi:hypothetical protein